MDSDYSDYSESDDSYDRPNSRNIGNPILRAEAIAEAAFDVHGRSFRASLDTDEEEWLEESEYYDYSLDHYRYLKIKEREKKEEKEEEMRKKLLVSKQRLASMRSMHSRQGPLSTVRYDPSLIEAISRHFSNITPTPKEEEMRKKLLLPKQRLALMRSMHSRQGPMSTVRYDPTLIEHVSKHLSNIRPIPNIYERMSREVSRDRINPYTEWLQDRSQLGSGQRSKRRSRRRKRNKSRRKY